jgi:hypothetical protein
MRLTGDWRRLHSEEIYGLYSSPDIQVMESKRMVWAGHVARMGGKEIHKGF